MFGFVDGSSHLAAFTPGNPAADAVLKASFPRPIAGFQPFDLAQTGEVQIADTGIDGYGNSGISPGHAVFAVHWSYP